MAYTTTSPTTSPGTTVKVLAKYAELFSQEPSASAATEQSREQPRFGFGSKGASKSWTPSARTERRDVRL